jgi:hypothetical protein
MMGRLIGAAFVMLAVATTPLEAAGPVDPAFDVVVVAAKADWPGKILVSHDERAWTEDGFVRAPGARQFARNVAAWFTGGRPGKFLVYSKNFGLTGATLASVMTEAGHTWTVTTDAPFTLATLQQYDAVFLTGTNPAVPTDVLTDYVRGGGRVFLGAGTCCDESVEAAQWNPFLHAFGLGYQPKLNNVANTVPIDSAEPVFAGVPSLYQGYGSVLEVTDPTNSNVRPLVSHSGYLLYAAYEGRSIPVPVNILPETCPNRLVLNGRGTARVAVLGTEALDVTAIDPASIRLLEARPWHWRYRDVGRPVQPLIGKTDLSACIDPDPDSHRDLILFFQVDDLTAALEQGLGRLVESGEAFAVTLSGTLKPEFGGAPIVGEDIVVVVRPNASDRNGRLLRLLDRVRQGQSSGNRAR